MSDSTYRRWLKTVLEQARIDFERAYLGSGGNGDDPQVKSASAAFERVARKWERLGFTGGGRSRQVAR